MYTVYQVPRMKTEHHLAKLQYQYQVLPLCTDRLVYSGYTPGCRYDSFCILYNGKFIDSYYFFIGNVAEYNLGISSIVSQRSQLFIEMWSRGRCDTRDLNIRATVPKGHPFATTATS